MGGSSFPMSLVRSFARTMLEFCQQKHGVSDRKWLSYEVSGNAVTFRKATMADKSTILSLRKNVYGGLDYLADYFHFFMHNPNRQCFVGEAENRLILFGVMLTLDGGKSIVGQAGRVHEQYEGLGYFRAMNTYFNSMARDNGCTGRVAMVAADLNKHVRSEKFKKSHVEISTKLHYAGVVTHSIRANLQQSIPSVNIDDVNFEYLEHIVNSETLRKYLFPGNKILLDYIPYECCSENITLLCGRNTKFHSSLRTTLSGVSGLLSAGSSFICSRPPESYTIDIFGHDHSDLEQHVLFHLRNAFTRTKGDFCLQIFVERGYMSEKLCNLLTGLDIPKCNWYVEGGVSVKSIVMEVLK